MMSPKFFSLATNFASIATENVEFYPFLPGALPLKCIIFFGPHESLGLVSEVFNSIKLNLNLFVACL